MNSPDLCKGLVLFHRTQKPYSNFIQINLRNIMCVFKLVSKTVLLSQYHFFIQTHTDIVQFLFFSFVSILSPKNHSHSTMQFLNCEIAGTRGVSICTLYIVHIIYRRSLYINALFYIL